MDKNVALGEEVRRTFGELDRIDAELKKASKAITSATGLVAKYRNGLQSLCEGAVSRKTPQQMPIDGGAVTIAGD